eukprot:2837838-Prymnesium_polylepis.1
MGVASRVGSCDGPRGPVGVHTSCSGGERAADRVSGDGHRRRSAATARQNAHRAGEVWRTMVVARDSAGFGESI